VSENTCFVSPVSPSTVDLNAPFKSAISAVSLVSNAVILSESDGAGAGAGSAIFIYPHIFFYGLIISYSKPVYKTMGGGLMQLMALRISTPYG